METNGAPLKVAVIGAGISGLMSSYLVSRRHQVVLFEAADYLGGHTNTVTVPSGPDAGSAVDTGFIVCNPTNYPLFYKFLDELSVERQDTDMCFGFYCQRSGLTYNGPRLKEFLVEPRALFNPSILKMIFEQRRFNRRILSDLRANKLGNQPLGDYLREIGASDFFIQHYLVPLAAAIWSSPDTGIEEFPILTFARFFNNHGMFEMSKIPRWQVVRGGSQQYVSAFRKSFKGDLRLNSAVTSVSRSQNGVQVTSRHGLEDFDKVIFATHANQTRSLLRDCSAAEAQALESWRYSRNHTILHTDTRVMPKSRKLWASWNYTRFNRANTMKSTGSAAVSVTYYMNRLQSLATTNHYFVSLNSAEYVDPKSIIYETTYEHPCFTPTSIDAQARLQQLNGTNHTYYCGAHLGYGFHEDGTASAVKVAQHFGVSF